MGKLAASLVGRQHRSVRLLTLDNFKMGAFDEICSYAEILGIEVVDPLKMDVDNASDKDVVTLIDAPAMPFDSEKLKTLHDRIQKINPTHSFAVFSYLTRSRDVFEISKRLKELNPTHLVLTMQDLASCHGTAVTAAKATGLKMAFVSDAPGGMGDLKSPDPDYLAGMLLNSEVTCE
jgi:flagellar biosynthesis protein FlhF